MFVKRFFKTAPLVGAAALALVGRPVAAQTTIDTTTGWNGTSAIVAWGPSAGTPNYGQTFTVGADNVLDNFTFYLRGDPFSFRGYVAQWTNGPGIGPVLFQSAPVALGSSLQTYTFTTGGLGLTTGATYIAFVSAFGLGGSGRGAAGWSGLDTYGGGGSTWNGSANYANWNAGVNGEDFPFRATFSPGGDAVPEPTSALLFLPGLAAFGLVRLRKKKQREMEAEAPAA